MHCLSSVVLVSRFGSRPMLVTDIRYNEKFTLVAFSFPMQEVANYQFMIVNGVRMKF